ncbi:MAG: hypothetical protein KJ077_47440 [Anaerolineae bacterium]|nr:hypothetical protein [Anaerolineae bacterium]
MLEFLRPIALFDTWLYFGLGLVALFFIRIIWLARRDRMRSIFTLEREHANARMTRAFIGLMVILSLALGIYYLSIVTPTIVPPPQDTPTPTPIIALPPTPTPPPLLPTPTPSLTPTPTLPPPTFEVEVTPTATTATVPVIGQTPNCPNPNARITQPGDGARVSGVIQISGAAMVDNFDYYKFEFRPPGGEWSFIQSYDNAVLGGALGSWNTGTAAPGEYEFRLVVVDTIGNYPEPCVIRLIVQ